MTACRIAARRGRRALGRRLLRHHLDPAVAFGYRAKLLTVSASPLRVLGSPDRQGSGPMTVTRSPMRERAAADLADRPKILDPFGTRAEAFGDALHAQRGIVEVHSSEPRGFDRRAHRIAPEILQQADARCSRSRRPWTGWRTWPLPNDGYLASRAAISAVHSPADAAGAPSAVASASNVARSESPAIRRITRADHHR